jgi:CBS domain containing-hemolysin-like protein
MITDILIILALIVLNGLFSMVEIALISSRKARLESQAAKGDADAARALKLANHPDGFLSTVQIGITLIGVLTGIYTCDNFKAPLQKSLSGKPKSSSNKSGWYFCIISTTCVAERATPFMEHVNFPLENKCPFWKACMYYVYHL